MSSPAHRRLLAFVRSKKRAQWSPLWENWSSPVRFDGKGIFVIPDVLANAGGVTVSDFEWVQALLEYFRSEKEVNQKL
jgi:glutamate dehydrogenase/leucine dehydrogenase